MHFYLTKAIDGNGDLIHEVDGTQLDAMASRKRLKDSHHAQVKTEEIDVPTDKPGLLAWLKKQYAGE